MPLPASHADGSILGNLFDDIKHIPERTIQQSRQLRVQQHLQAIQQQAQQDQYHQSLVNEADQYGLDPAKNDDGSMNYIATAVKVQKAKELRGRVMAHLGRTDTNADATAAEAAKYGLPAGDTTPQDDAAPRAGPAPVPAPVSLPGQNPQGAAVAPQPAAPVDDDFDPTMPQAVPAAPAALAPPMPLAQQVAQAATAASLAKSKADDQARTDILAKERTTTRNEKDIDTFRGEFGRDPTRAELNPDGSLNATGLGALTDARNNRIKGFMPDGKNGLTPIPGGPAALKVQADQDKMTASKDAMAAKQQMLTDTHAALLDNIGTALGQVGRTTAGNVAGSDLVRHIPLIGQGAQDLHSNLDAIKAGLGVDTLNSMRASSTSGNTGIGRIMQVEFDAFSKAARNLDQTQSPDQLQRNLESLQYHLQRWKQAKAKSDATAAPAASGFATPAAPAAPAAGKSIDDLVSYYTKPKS